MSTRKRNVSGGSKNRGSGLAIDIQGLGVDIAYGVADNPTYTRARRDSLENSKQIHVARNLNESPLVRLVARGTIDECQALAGHRLRALVERVEGGGRSASFLRERVDGGGRPDGFADTRIDAGRRLEAASNAIGLHLFSVARTVCGDGVSLNELARRRRCRQGTVRDTLREALDALAEVWGLSQPRPR